MNRKYAVKLNLDMKLFNSELPTIEFLQQYILKTYNDVEGYRYFQAPNYIVSNEIKNFLTKHNQRFNFMEIIYAPANTTLGIHSDEEILGSYSKINWVFNGKDSKMIWYNLKDISMTGKKSLYAAYGDNAIHFDKNDLEIAHSEELQGPTLVEVGCPHNMQNGTIESRWCVGVNYTNNYTTNTYHRPTIKESIEIFKDYIIGDPERI